MRGSFLGGCLLLDCAVAALVLPDYSLMRPLAFCRRRHQQGSARAQNGAQDSRSLSRCGLAWRAAVPPSLRCCFLRAGFFSSYSNCCCTAGSLRLAFIVLQVTVSHGCSSGQRRCRHRASITGASGARGSRRCGRALCQALSCHVSNCVRFSCATACPRWLASCFV